MKKQLLKTMLLLFALIAGSSSAWADEYVKVTSTEDITDGEYLIVYEAGNVAFNGSLTTLDAASNTVAVTISDGKIASSDAIDAATFTIDVTNGTIKSSSGKYIGVSSNSNGLKQTTEAATYTNSFSIDNDENAVISAVFDGSTMTLRYNKSSGQERFRYYKSGQQAIALYKKVESGVTDNRIATTITQENIVLDLADVATLTRLAPVVKDKDGNVIAYQYDEFPTDVSFDIVSDETPIISSLSNNTGEIELISVAGTATLKAYYNYWNTSDVYKPSECTFTITVVSPLDNVAALTAKTEAGTYQVKLTEAVVTYVNGNYAYIQDASGAVVMYKSGHGLNAGDVLDGTATVAYQVRNGNPQITSLEGVTPTAGAAPAPTVIAAEAWDFTFTNVLSQYFQVTGATLTKSGTKYYVELDGENIQLYKVGTALGDLDLTKTYIITGFPTLYNSTKELQIFVDPEEEIVITDAKYATFVSSRDVDFSTTGITAYTAQVSGSSVALTEITKVPANTPVVLYKADADGTAVTVPTATSTDEVGTNELLVSDGTVKGGDGIYALANGTNGVGFYKVATTVTIPAGKCYLSIAAGAPDFLGFDGNATGIKSVDSGQVTVDSYYNLAGQRVAQPTKGLYIINGRKVVIK